MPMLPGPIAAAVVSSKELPTELVHRVGANERVLLASVEGQLTARVAGVGLAADETVVGLDVPEEGSRILASPEGDFEVTTSQDSIGKFGRDVLCLFHA